MSRLLEFREYFLQCGIWYLFINLLWVLGKWHILHGIKAEIYIFRSYSVYQLLLMTLFRSLFNLFVCLFFPDSSCFLPFVSFSVYLNYFCFIRINTMKCRYLWYLCLYCRFYPVSLRASVLIFVTLWTNLTFT